MTIRLLKPYAQRPVGAIATFDASTEAAMIAASQASADLTGGFEYFLPRPGLRLQAPQIAVGSLTLRAAEQAPVPLPEGQVLNVFGSIGTTGKVNRLDPVGGNAVLQSWAVGAGSQLLIGPYAGQQRFVVTCATGSIDVGVGSAVLTAARTTTTGALLDAAGNTRPLISRPIRNILRFGDSVIDLSEYFGLSFNVFAGGSCRFMPGGVSSVFRASVNTPDGVSTLGYSAARQTLWWGAPGDTVGPEVPIKDGVFWLPSANPTYVLRVPVTKRWLSATDQVDNITSTPGERYMRKPEGGTQYAVEAMTGGRFNFLPNLGIGGNTVEDGAARLDQVLALIQGGGVDLVEYRFLGNSIVSGQVAPAVAVAAAAATIRQIIATGTPVIVYLLSPRSAGALATAGAAVKPTPITGAQKNSIICTGNALLEAELRSTAGVYFVDIYSECTDSRTGYAKTGATSDGIHWLNGVSYPAARAVARILNGLSPDDRRRRNVSPSSYYDATYNPGGNRLVNNQGAFDSVGGAMGAGVSAVPLWVAGAAVAAATYAINLKAAAATVTIANPGIWTQAAHGLAQDQPIKITTTGALPAGLVAGTQYYATPLSADSYTLSATPGGAAIATTGSQSGAHTVTSQVGDLYYSALGGTAGATPPTHVRDSLSDGGVIWTYVRSGATPGIAAGVTAIASGTTVACCKLADTGTAAGGLELFVSGATFDGNNVRVFLQPASLPPVGQRARFMVEVEVGGPGCYGVYIECIFTTTGYNVIWDNRSLMNVPQGLDAGRYLLSLQELAWPAGVTAATFRIFVQSKAGASFPVRLRSADFHDVL